MLSYISVDGFKSLTEFALTLLPGLNVFVGPNGSGKTNIISFFGFLGDLQRMSVSNAICNAGGTGSVFTKIGEDKYRADMACCVSGNIRLAKRRFIFYRYTFSIVIRDSLETISYRSQRLEAKYCTVMTRFDKIPKGMDLDIELTHGEEGKQPVTSIYALDRRKIRSRYGYLARRSGKITKAEGHAQIAEILTEQVGVDESLINGLRFVFDQSRIIYSDLLGGQAFNIVPSSVRTPEDSAKTPGYKQ